MKQVGEQLMKTLKVGLWLTYMQAHTHKHSCMLTHTQNHVHSYTKEYRPSWQKERTFYIYNYEKVYFYNMKMILLANYINWNGIILYVCVCMGVGVGVYTCSGQRKISIVSPLHMWFSRIELRSAQKQGSFLYPDS